MHPRDLSLLKTRKSKCKKDVEIRWFGRSFGARLASSRSEGKHPGAKELKSSSSVHLPLQRLQSIDVPFGGTIAPNVCDRMFYRRPILLQLANKAIHRRDTGGLC